MKMDFRRIGRGAGWERWMMVEEQNTDHAFAGEVILTYSDMTSFAEVECDVLAARELDDEEADYVLESVLRILSGRGTVNLFCASQVVSKDFDLVMDSGDDEDEPDND